MFWGVYILIFIVSSIFLYISTELIVKGLLRFSRSLGLKEFVVAFFVMALASSLPNLFVGITSAINDIPELSFGDILGNNLIALTLAVGIAIFFAKNNEIPAESETIQVTSIFTIVAAILPIILIVDGKLGRGDGLVLIGLFFFYVFWLFSKKERFEKIYEENSVDILKEIKSLLANIAKILLGIGLLFISARGIVFSAVAIAETFNLSNVLIGIFIVGFGSALPEIYFAIHSAKKDQTSMILGNLMGAVIIPASLVLGIVVLINPIYVDRLGLFFISRFFLLCAAFFFFFFTKTDRKITRIEGYLLVFLYVLFVTTVFVWK